MKKPGSKDANHGYAWSQVTRIQRERDHAEAQRLLYVALTRARDYVIVSGEKPSESSLEKSSTWLADILRSGIVDHEGIIESGSLAEVAIVEPDAASADVLHGRPLLLGGISPAAPIRNRHITATTLAHLGRVRHATDRGARHLARQRARKNLVGDQRGALTRVSDGQAPSGRLIGELVHEALQYGYDALPDSQRERLLRGMIWDSGLSDRSAQERALERCESLLARLERMPLTREIRQSRAIMREVPFILTREGQIIHGVIDLLYRDTDKSWVLVDYKTDYVPEDMRGNLAEMARTYHLQLAIYAEAAAERLGSRPRVRLCFVNVGTVDISEDELRAALDSALITQIQDVLAEDVEVGG